MSSASFQDLTRPLAALVLGYCQENITLKANQTIVRHLTFRMHGTLVSLDFDYEKISKVFEAAAENALVVSYFRSLTMADLKIGDLSTFAVTTFTFTEEEYPSFDPTVELNLFKRVSEAAQFVLSNPACELEYYKRMLSISNAIQVLGIEQGNSAPQQKLAVTDVTTTSTHEEMHIGLDGGLFRGTHMCF